MKEVQVSELTKVSFQDHSLLCQLLVDKIKILKFLFCLSLKVFLMTYDDLTIWICGCIIFCSTLVGTGRNFKIVFYFPSSCVASLVLVVIANSSTLYG